MLPPSLVLQLSQGAYQDHHYQLLDSASADSSLLPPRMALKPDKVLLNYEEKIDHKLEQKRTNSVLGFLEAGVGILATTAAVISTENPAYLADGLLSTVETAGYYAGKDKQIKNDLELIKEEKEVVDEELFRTCHVGTGETVSGFVFFPEHPEACYYLFCFPLENQLFQFVYSQEKVLVYD